jgi:hypothetical protein
MRWLFLAGLLAAIGLGVPASANLLQMPITAPVFTFPYQVGVTDTLQTAGTLPFQVGQP